MKSYTSFFTIALLALPSGADGQGYSRTTSNGTRIRIRADTTWEVFPDGHTKRTILKRDTLIVTAERAGSSSTTTWLLGHDSSRVVEYDGNLPLRRTMSTGVVMMDWEFARFDRLFQTGVDGPTYPYDRPTRDFTTRIQGDTVWMDHSNGDTYRSVLHGDTLTVLNQRAGQRARAEVWLIRGDSAHMIDLAGKTVMSIPKNVVLATRKIAEINQSIQSLRP